MKAEVLVHEAEEGDFGEVPAIPGCTTQGDTLQELLQNLYEAVEGCLLSLRKQLRTGSEATGTTSR